jgi:NAD(P)-dependent dehydrogenase (short-subunit alcohol dehydrogenase family)
MALRGATLAGKRAIVTGATSGIGRETARVLALAGAEVVIAARDADSGRLVAEELASGLPRGVGSLRSAELDLADLASVRRFVERRESPVDLLVNNAGVMATPLSQTKQGLELQLGTNHVGHFVLTLGLLPALRAAGGGRVVTVSSALHRRGRGARLLRTLLDDPRYERRRYAPFDAYGDSKLANIVFAKELARRAPEVLSVSLHPGVIPTRLTRSLGALGALYRAVGAPFMKSVAEGAATSVYAATAAELGATPGVYLADCAVARPTAEAEDPRLAQDVWAASERWLGAESADRE